MNHLFAAGAVLFACFATIAMLDGAYLHIYKYKLHTRRESYVEHVTHTLHAILFPAIVFLLLFRNRAGLALYAAVVIVLVDVGIESWDVLIERDSRASLGGLSPLEYWIHVIAITLRVAGIAVLLALKPVAAWRPDASWLLVEQPPQWVQWTALALIIGGAFTALQHTWLLRSKYRVTGS